MTEKKWYDWNIIRRIQYILIVTPFSVAMMYLAGAVFEYPQEFAIFVTGLMAITGFFMILIESQIRSELEFQRTIDSALDSMTRRDHD